MVPQEYTISDTAKTYQIMPFTTDPPGCPVTYTYAVGPPAAQDVVSFDEATLTFTFFNDQDVGIAMNTPYGILITGEAGTVTTVQAMSQPPLLLTIKNPCIDSNFVSVSTTALSN